MYVRQARWCRCVLFAFSFLPAYAGIFNRPFPGPVSSNPFDGISGPQQLLIVAPAAFLPALQPLIQHKQAIGISTFAVSMESLSFLAAVDDPARIKQAIQYAHEHLGTQDVLLMGDASQVPVRYEMIFAAGGGFTDGQYWPSDLYYANLYHHTITPMLWFGPLVSPGPADNWDANGDGFYNEMNWKDSAPNPDNVDGYPDVALGRVPAHTAADVNNFVQKVIRYETQPGYQPLLTFLADAGYPSSQDLSNNIIASSGAGNYFVNRIRVNTDSTTPAPAQWWNDTPLSGVASSINVSSWVTYLGHGWQQGWDGPSTDYVSGSALNSALPVVYSTGCSTGAFAPHPAGLDEGYGEQSSNLNDYLDTTGRDWDFRLTGEGWQLWGGGAGPGFQSGDIGAIVVDVNSGLTWGNGCFSGCTSSMPVVTPKPAAYDRADRSAFGYSYPWLLGNPQGGAIAYFGEAGVTYPSSAMELEEYMLTNYFAGDRTLGSIYLRAEQQYWQAHYADRGTQTQSRIYLGWMVFFGDPTLQMQAPLRAFF